MNKANNEEVFFKLIKDSFMMKRKNIRNNLRSYDLNIVEKVLNNYGLDLNSRAENIPLNCFIEIANEISK
jgi:16S rRNA A1518/A1519 N6-dimethyltransferase RsmA/KsgA/DIM1 with predicted DNA glycosylase/AP lyase activity